MKSLKENLEEINSISLKEIIERFGGTFVSDSKFKCLSIWGDEKTPSGSIKLYGDKERWTHFKSGQSGDALDFVKLAMNCDEAKAIDLILNQSNNFTFKSKEAIAKENEKALKEKADKDRKTMFAIAKNSKYVLDSDLGVTYLEKRGILNAYKNLKDPKFTILVNEYTQNGEKINKICYYFKKDEKNNEHRFMITKEIDKKGNKNSEKRNLVLSMPIMHQQSTGKPIIICEGMEDAISSIELGYENFISLNSTSNVNKILNGLQKHPNFYRINQVELCLDNDKSGIEATNKIKAACYIQDLYMKGKMPQFLNKLSTIMDKNKDFVIKTLKKYSRIENMKDYELRDVTGILANNSSLIKGYGNYFKIKESEWFTILKELHCNDLNDLLVKIIKETEKVEKAFGSNNKRKEMER